MKELNQILKSTHNNRPFALDVRWEEGDYQKPIILFVHGFKGFKDWGPFNQMADYFAKNGFVFAKLNLSHNGTTPDQPLDFVDLEAFGNNNFSIELDDIGLAIDFLLESPSLMPLNSSNLYLLGHSRGGGLVILKAAEDSRVKRVVTWAAVSDYESFLSVEDMETWEKEGVRYIYNGRTKQDMPLYYQIYEDLKANHKRLDILKSVTKLKQPMLIIHGMDDESVPLKAAQQLHSRNANSQLFLVKDGTHTFSGYHPYKEHELIEPLRSVIDKSISFFKQN